MKLTVESMIVWINEWSEKILHQCSYQVAKFYDKYFDKKLIDYASKWRITITFKAIYYMIMGEKNLNGRFSHLQVRAVNDFFLWKRMWYLYLTVMSAHSLSFFLSWSKQEKQIKILSQAKSSRLQACLLLLVDKKCS